MARMTVIGSGSNGNGYVLKAGGETLLLEAGLEQADVVRACGYDLSGVRGCLVSHEHADHAKHAGDLTAHGIHVFGTEGVGKRKSIRHSWFHVCQPGRLLRLGGFTVMPMHTPHDVPCLAYVIRHADMGTLLFATDTPYLEFSVNGVNHVMLEADYEPAVLKANLESGAIDRKRRDRVVLNHMSLPTALETIAALDDGHLRSVTLVHLSAMNASPRAFELIAREETGLPVRCARKGLVVEMGNGTGAPF